MTLFKHIFITFIIVRFKVKILLKDDTNRERWIKDEPIDTERHTDRHTDRQMDGQIDGIGLINLLIDGSLIDRLNDNQLFHDSVHSLCFS